MSIIFHVKSSLCSHICRLSNHLVVTSTCNWICTFIHGYFNFNFSPLTFLSILNLFQLEFSTAGFRRALFYQFLSRTAFDYLWKWRKQSYRRDNKSASNWPFFLYIFYLQMNTFRKIIWSLGLTYYSNSCSLLSSPPMFSVTLSDSLLAFGWKG